MRKKPLILQTVFWLVLGTLSATARPATRASGPALLKSVTLASGASEKDLLLAVEGRYTYTTLAVDSRTTMIDLKGVKASGVPKQGQWKDEWLAGYRLFEYTSADHQPVVRLEVTQKGSQPFEAHRDKAGLRLSFGPARALASAAPVPLPRSRPTKEPSGSGKKAALHPASRNQGADPPTSLGVPERSQRERSLSAVPGPVLVKGVIVKAATAEETFVDILTSGSPAYQVRRLEGPARIVVDFEDARFAGGQRAYAVHSAQVKSVRIAQFQAGHPAIFRVVADLERDLDCNVHPQAGGMRIELTPHGQAQSADKGDRALATVPPPPIPEVKAKPDAAQTAPSEASSLEASNDPSSANVSRSTEANPTDVRPLTNRGQASPVGPLQSSSDVAASPRIQVSGATPESLRAAKAARILASTDPTLADGQGQAPAAAAAPATQEKPKYTGEPISLNLKDVDLKDFFRLIHEISGLNIIVDPNIEGKVTLVLDSVPWDQALDLVLKDNRLDKVLEGNVLRIAKLETLAAEQEAVKKLAEAREEAQPLVTVFRHINYAKAGTIQTMLKGWVGGGALTKRGSILVDDRLGTLIISDIQTQIPIIQAIIDKLDVKSKQLSIEARIVIASSSFSRTLGTILNGATTNKSGSTAVAGATGTGASTGVAPPPLAVTTATTSGFGVFAISNSSSRYLIEAAINAQESKSLAKTISRPSIVTQNNVPGTVQQGVQIPIQTTINNTISITYVAATLALTVTPQVTEDGNVFLQISVTNSSPGDVLTGAGPSIKTQSATTQVLVPDGGVVVFGGVTITSRTKAATYVPLIGSIPIVGHLFKTSNASDSDNELLFFVSPKVLPG